MTKVIEPTKVGKVTLDHVTVTPEQSRLAQILGDDGLHYCPPGTYARLLIDEGGWRGPVCVMSDTRMERLTNYTVTQEARGDVLIAGLGLGMILIPILKNPRVRSVTVIECDEDVIAAVDPQLRCILSARANDKLTIIHGDIHAWRPAEARRQFDVIYFDIWHEVSTDHLTEMSALRMAFKGYMRVGGWSGCWKQEYLRDERRRCG